MNFMDNKFPNQEKLLIKTPNQGVIFLLNY